MDYHFDRKVILNPDSKHKSLYEWSLQELDSNGKVFERDQIPWGWSFYFIASDLSLRDTISLETKYGDDSDEKKVVLDERRFISAKLNPERRNGRLRETSFSMFGTGRTISRFELYIEKLGSENDSERCVAWGTVSYTAEIDFRDETCDDCIIFMMYLSPKRFASYAEKIASSAVDEVGFRVTGVSGFYSDWSPGISTDKVKVLTDHKEHVVAIPKNCTINPPRLGDVFEANLHFRKICELGNETQDISKEEENSDHDEERPAESGNAEDPVDDIRGLNVVVTRAVKILSSVRLAAWFICGLLFLLLILKH